MSSTRSQKPNGQTDLQGSADAHRRADSIWIVGGGPSLTGFDFDVLRGSYVMCCNDSFLSLPWADAVVSIDARWIHNRRDKLEQFAGRKYLCRRDGVALPEITDAVELISISEPGISTGWTEVIHGCTTGYAALNVAVLLGAKFVGLLGFDYQASGHWHSEYEWRSAADGSIWRQWARAFDSTVEELQRRRVRVVNFNPDSAVMAFERAPLSSIREML